MRFHPKMQFIDLKFHSPIGHTAALMREEMAYEYRENRFYSTVCIFKKIELERRLGNKEVVNSN